MADRMNYQKFDTSETDTKSIAQQIESMMQSSVFQRRQIERRWYDNNFFDDGFHFRYVSRETGKIIDLAERSNMNLPQRAIPKASRQIRGIANLLMGPEYQPVIYPYKITRTNFPNPEDYQKAYQYSKQIASKIGSWIENDWKQKGLKELLTFMAMLSAKNAISYMQIWPDEFDEKINMKVFDAFDIYLMGNLNFIEDCPFIIKAIPQPIEKIKSNSKFDKEQLDKLNPDNRYASSEIKQAYMISRYSTGISTDKAATIILKESFIKEYLSDKNWASAVAKSKNTGAMEGKSKGDVIMRHVFSCAGIWLRDEYVAIDEYPFVDFRYEPGPIYQVPLIERFIPANKSLDTVMSRVERYANTMVTGTWLKRRGEDVTIANIPGGQILEYTATPPTQGQIANIPPFLFEFIGLLNNIIEEQGAATSALGQLPSGVRSGVAIESIKATEYANLKIASDQMKSTVRRIAQKMIKIASKYYITPQTVYNLKKGEPEYFDIIGEAGVEARRKAQIDVPQGVVPISADTQVDIQVESGLGFTAEGKKETMQQIAQFMVQLATQGYLTQPAVNQVITKFLEIFQFGSTGEFMDAMETGTQSSPLNEDQITQMKIAVVEAMKDAGVVGQDDKKGDEEDILKAKIGAMEAIKDAGLIEKEPQVDPIEEAKAQLEMRLSEETHQVDLQGKQQKQKINILKASQDMELKRKQTEFNISNSKKQNEKGNQSGNR